MRSSATQPFLSRASSPSDTELERELGCAIAHWNALVDHAVTWYDGTPEWRHYGASAGWVLELSCGRHPVLYMMPMRGGFEVSFIFDERSLVEALTSDLPDEIIARVIGATNSLEGRAFRIAIATERDLAIARELLAIRYS